MKPGKHQRSKQRCQDLYWRVHDRAQSFVSPSCIMHGYVIKIFLLVSSSVSSKQPLCFVHGQDQKREQKRTTKNFIEFYKHSPLLTLFIRTSILTLYDRKRDEYVSFHFD